MKKIICIFTSLLLVLGMTSCNSILNAPDDTQEGLTEPTTDSVFDIQVNSDFYRYYYYETVEEYNTFINSTEMPGWFIPYEDLSYIGEFSKMAIEYWGPSLSDSALTSEALDEHSIIRYYFSGYEEMFYIELRKHDSDNEIINNFSEGIEEENILEVDAEKYFSKNRHCAFYFEGMMGIVNIGKYSYDWYGTLTEISFVMNSDNSLKENVQVKIVFLTELTNENGVERTVARYDMSNSEINRFLNRSTIKYAFGIIGSSCTLGVNMRYVYIPEEYR